MRYREEERERKRRSQRAEAERAVTRSGPAAGGCHAPGGTRKARQSQEEFDRICDELCELSRAAWERELRRITRQIWRKSRQSWAVTEVQSRAV